jgi:hypothetical protein
LLEQKGKYQRKTQTCRNNDELSPFARGNEMKLPPSAGKRPAKKPRVSNNISFLRFALSDKAFVIVSEGGTRRFEPSFKYDPVEVVAICCN